MIIACKVLRVYMFSKWYSYDELSTLLRNDSVNYCDKYPTHAQYICFLPFFFEFLRIIHKKCVCISFEVYVHTFWDCLFRIFSFGKTTIHTTSMTFLHGCLMQIRYNMNLQLVFLLFIAGMTCYRVYTQFSRIFRCQLRLKRSVSQYKFRSVFFEFSSGDLSLVLHSRISFLRRNESVNHDVDRFSAFRRRTKEKSWIEGSRCTNVERMVRETASSTKGIGQRISVIFT